MYRNHGQNLIEVCVIGALVVVIGIGVYTMLGKNIHQMLSSSNSSFQQYIPFDFSKKSSNNNLESPKGDLGGSSSNPVSNCIQGDCSIDFGNFLLSGIPEDFNQFVTINGASGGSKKLSELMGQVADQLEEEGLIEEALEVKKLASLGHNMAAIEDSVEKLLNSCNYDEKCIREYKDKKMPKPENFDETYINYSDVSYNNALKSILLGGCGFTGYDNLDSLAPLYLSVLDKVKSQEKIPQSTKNIIEELSWDIGVIGEDFQNNVDFFSNWSADDSKLDTNKFTDPLTFEKTIVASPDNIKDNFINYNASKITNLDSSLICVSGKGNDTGTKCH